MGLQRVRHDWVAFTLSLSQHILVYWYTSESVNILVPLMIITVFWDWLCWLAQNLVLMVPNLEQHLDNSSVIRMGDFLSLITPFHYNTSVYVSPGQFSGPFHAPIQGAWLHGQSLQPSTIRSPLCGQCLLWVQLQSKCVLLWTCEENHLHPHSQMKSSCGSNKRPASLLHKMPEE